MTENQSTVTRGAGKGKLIALLAFALGVCLTMLVLFTLPAATRSRLFGLDAPSADSAPAQDEPLDVATAFPSWDADSASLAELTNFVESVCDPDSPNYREPADRIATFDMDGTLISEKAPYYLDYMLLIHRVLDDPTYQADDDTIALINEVRAYAERGEKNSDLSAGRHKASDEAFAGMTPEEFHAYVNDFLDTVEVGGFDGMTYGSSFYQPMTEVIDYLRANDFDIWVVSASEREIVRATVERLGIEPDHVIGADIAYATTRQGDEDPTDYTMGSDEDVVLSVPLTDDCERTNKSFAIAREIGRKPILAFGNSSGDYAMLNYAEGSSGMGLLVVADDEAREYGDAGKAEDAYAKAEEQSWTTFSMKDDWTTIYGDGVTKTELPGLAADADSLSQPQAADLPDYSQQDLWAYYGIGEDKDADLFIICPTVDTKDEYNMSLDDEETKEKFMGALNMERGIYEDDTRMFAPYYRQASMGVYSLDADEREPYLQFAYEDVSAAFSYYLEHENDGRPIVLAGFSQGADLCYRLLEEYFADETLQEQLVAVYALG